MNLRPLCEGIGFAALCVAGLLVVGDILRQFEWTGALALIATVGLVLMLARFRRGV